MAETSEIFMLGLLFIVLLVSGLVTLDQGAMEPWLKLVNEPSGFMELSKGAVLLAFVGVALVVVKAEKII